MLLIIQCLVSSYALHLKVFLFIWKIQAMNAAVRRHRKYQAFILDHSANEESCVPIILNMESKSVKVKIVAGPTATAETRILLLWQYSISSLF